jgi:hypothetical protein
MTTPPPCRSLGGQCRELPVTLSIANFDDDRAPDRDALATWLLGHTERISFGVPRRTGQRLVVDATVHVPCRFLQESDEDPATQGVAHGAAEAGAATRRRRVTHGRKANDLAKKVTCAAHGFVGVMPPTTQRPYRPSPTDNDGRLALVYRGRPQVLALDYRTAPRRRLPVLADGNPCHGAPCRTADNRAGAACCRDLTLEVVAPADERRSDRLESLLRTRRSPYLCKVERADARIIECEVISACHYLAADQISCVLHDRKRPDGRPAKPGVCSRWPDLGPDDVGHPGCRLIPKKGEK